MEQPQLPNLPPMPQASASSPQPIPAMQKQGNASAQSHMPTGGSRRLRQIVTSVAGGGFALVMVVGVCELALPETYKPTTMLARFEAQTDLKIFNQKLGRPAGEVTLTEDQYREKLAEAERRGQAKAEIVFQREMANVQADKELLVGAYQSLYQRTNIIAQAAMQMEVVAQQFRQRLMEMTNGGRSVVIGVKDIFCGLGSPEACDSARNDRQNMIGEATELTKGQVAQQVNELMAQIPDPATLQVRAHANAER